MPTTKINSFCEALATAPLQEVEIAAAVAWYLAESTGETPNIEQIADVIEQQALRSRLNRSRLRERLKANRVVIISKDGTVRLKLAAKAEYLATYGHFLQRMMPEVADHVLEASDFMSLRSYVQKLVYQVNASYGAMLYDCCAVMMRRLTEVLIIDGYEEFGISKEITADGDYIPLSALIGKISSGAHFKLGRGQKAVLERVKSLGDTAAHGRNYITKRVDIDEVKSEYRRLIAELQALKAVVAI
ncbi:MAG: hypothetical protein ABIQ30_12220 [Devosia sp.]